MTRPASVLRGCCSMALAFCSALSHERVFALWRVKPRSVEMANHFGQWQCPQDLSFLFGQSLMWRV